MRTSASLSRFQSTPAITGERASRARVGRQRPPCFNPRPPLLASEPALAMAAASSLPCFNPRPPLLASEPPGRRCRRPGLPVSIHARHYWRASRPLTLRSILAGRVSIHARHYWRASHHRPFGRIRRTWFQSTPAITGERAWRGFRRCCRIGLFQSTPAITGERANARRPRC